MRRCCGEIRFLHDSLQAVEQLSRCHRLAFLIQHRHRLDFGRASLGEEARRAGLDLDVLHHRLSDLEGLDEDRDQRQCDEKDHHEHRRRHESKEGLEFHLIPLNPPLQERLKARSLRLW